MTMSYSIDHIPATVHSVDLPDNETSLGLQGPDPASSKDEISSKYVSLTGDPAFLASITYRSADAKRGGNPVKRIAITRVNWMTATDSVTGLVTRAPIAFNISVNAPSNFTVEPVDVTLGLKDTVSYMLPATGDEFGIIAKLLFGITAVR